MPLKQIPVSPEYWGGGGENDTAGSSDIGGDADIDKNIGTGSTNGSNADGSSSTDGSSTDGSSNTNGSNGINEAGNTVEKPDTSDRYDSHSIGDTVNQSNQGNTVDIPGSPVPQANLPEGVSGTGETAPDDDELDEKWVQIGVKDWQPDEGEYDYDPESEVGTMFCYVPVLSDKYELDPSVDLPRIFIEVVEEEAAYLTPAMDSVYGFIRALPDMEELTELLEQMSLATASELPDIEGISDKVKTAKDAYDDLGEEEQEKFDAGMYQKLMDLDAFFSNMRMMNVMTAGTISIRVNNKTELTGNGLQDALKKQSGTVTSLEILGGAVTEEDWNYLKDLDSLESFVLNMGNGPDGMTDEVADMPDSSNTSLFPKSIANVELSQAANIGAYAFDGCRQLDYLTLPDSVKSIGQEAFNTGERLVVTLCHQNYSEGETWIDSIVSSASSASKSKPLIIRTDNKEIGRKIHQKCTNVNGVKVVLASDLDEKLEPSSNKNGDLAFIQAEPSGYYDVKGVNGSDQSDWVKTTYANFGYAAGIAIGTGITSFNSCTSIKNLEREPVFININSGEIMAAGISADFVSNGKYLKVTHTLVNVSDNDLYQVNLGVNADIQIGNSDSAPIYRTGTGFRMEEIENSSGRNQQFSLACKNAPGVDDVSTMWFGHFRSKESYQFSDTDADSLTGMDSGLAFSWQNMTIPAGESITRSVLFSVGEIAEPPVLPEENPFTFSINASGTKSIRVDAKVKDKEGLADTLYYTIEKDGAPSVGETVLKSITADGKEQTISGVIEEDNFKEDGTYTITVWIMNDAGAISKSVKRDIIISDGVITGGIDIPLNKQTLSGTTSYSRLLTDPDFTLDKITTDNQEEGSGVSYSLKEDNGVIGLHTTEAGTQVRIKKPGTAVIAAKAARTANYAEESLEITVVIRSIPILNKPGMKNITSTDAELEGVIINGTMAFDNVIMDYKKCGGQEDYRTIAYDTPSISDDGLTTSMKAVLGNLEPDSDYLARIRLSYGEENQVQEQFVRFRTLPVDQPKGEISGVVTDGSGLDTPIYVTLGMGTTVQAGFGPLKSGETFRFKGLADGSYNLVADNGSYKTTRIVVIENGSVQAQIDMQIGKTQSVIDIVTEDTPEIVVGGLDSLFDSNALYSEEDESAVNDGGTVEFKLQVEKKEQESISQDAAMIEKKIDGSEKIGIYLDIQVLKTVKDAQGRLLNGETEQVPDLKDKELLLVIPIPAEIQGMAPYQVYSIHNGSVTRAESIYQEKYQTICVTADRFSTYAIAYTAPDTEGTESRASTDRGDNSGAVTEGTWMQDDVGWWYRYNNGTWPSGGWAYLFYNKSYDWYYFDPRGYMMEGWIEIDGQWYFLHRNSDGSKGHMYTGLHQIDEKWYYFDDNGVMFSNGWKNAEGKWRYFYEDGSMAVSTRIGGYIVNEEGAIIN